MSDGYGYVPDKLPIHAKHIVHYWIGHKDGYLFCACGQTKGKTTKT